MGNRYKLFLRPLKLKVLANELISLKKLEEFSDNLDPFITCVFLFPFYMLIKYTAVMMILAIIYSSMKKAQKNISLKDQYNGNYYPISFKEFLDLSSILLLRRSNQKKHGSSAIYRFIKTTPFKPEKNIYMKLVDTISQIENKGLMVWKREIGPRVLHEVYDRDRNMMKHRLRIFKLMAYSIDNHGNFFVKESKNPEIKNAAMRMIDFYKIYIRHFRTGYNQLQEFYTKQVKSNESLKKDLMERDINDVKLMKMKFQIWNLTENLEDSFLKNDIYRHI